MAKFRVRDRVVVWHTYELEADNPSEAKRKVLEGSESELEDLLVSREYGEVKLDFLYEIEEDS